MVASKLAKYNLDLVAVQEVRWDKGGSEPAGDYTFLCGNGNPDCNLRTGFFMNMGIVSGSKRIEFISDSVSYVTPKGC
jgi:hypothetical protein